MRAANKTELSALRAQRATVRQNYGRHIQSAAQCRHEAARLDAAIKGALEQQNATDGD